MIKSSFVESADSANDDADLSSRSTGSIRHYLATRIPTLLDFPVRSDPQKWHEVVNPFPPLKEMTTSDWNFYCLGFFAWTVDALDFFCVSAAAPEIAASLGVSIADISWGVTLVLMLRSVGSIIFGIASDRYGRKWPYIVICGLFVIIELLTGFVVNFRQFLGVRAIFGILMGAMYPVASLTALEDQPTKARLILSGLFLPGYSFGYLLAVVFYRAFQFSYKPGEGWRALFWFLAGLPVILIVWRLFWPESRLFLHMKAARSQSLDVENPGTHSHTSLLKTLRKEWLMFGYLVLMMAGFNFTSHGSQDLYPTLLVKQYKMGPDMKTIILVVVNIGAMMGGIFFGQLTELLGRRFTIVLCMVLSGAFLYPSFFSPTYHGIFGGFFFLNFCIMGAWGVVPIHILELVNPGHRAFLSGVVYQLGNLASSGSITIEAKLSEKYPLATGGYDYGRVMGIFCGAVFAYMIVIIVVGPERFHRDLVAEAQGNAMGQVEVTSEIEKPETMSTK